MSDNNVNARETTPTKRELSAIEQGRALRNACDRTRRQIVSEYLREATAEEAAQRLTDNGTRYLPTYRGIGTVNTTGEIPIPVQREDGGA